MSVFKMQDQEKLSVKGAIILCRPYEQSTRMFDYWIIGSKGAKSQVDSQKVYKELNLNVVIVVRMADCALHHTYQLNLDKWSLIYKI